MLLITVFASVSSDYTTADAAILINEGAQRYHITKELADALQLPSEGMETHSVTGFGECSSRHLQQMEHCNVCVLSESKQNIPVRVRIVPTIVAPISCT